MAKKEKGVKQKVKATADHRVHELQLAIAKQPAKMKGLVNAVGFVGLVYLYKQGFNLMAWLGFSGSKTATEIREAAFGFPIYGLLGVTVNHLWGEDIAEFFGAGAPSVTTTKVHTVRGDAPVKQAVSEINLREIKKMIADDRSYTQHIRRLTETLRDYTGPGEERERLIRQLNALNRLQAELRSNLQALHSDDTGLLVAPGVSSEEILDRVEWGAWLAAIGLAYMTMLFLQQFTVDKAIEAIPFFE